MLRILVFILFVGLFKTTSASENTLVLSQIEQINTLYEYNQLIVLSGDTTLKKERSKKWTAILLTVLTGPLGGHRIFLGASAKVPIVYTLTLGGGFGILPLVDLIYMLVTKKYPLLQNSNRIIAITGKVEESTTLQ